MWQYWSIFPWTAFFADDLIKAGTELCWDYYHYNHTAGTGRFKTTFVCGSCNGKFFFI